MVNLDTKLRTSILTIGLVAALASIPAVADVEVVTPDGKRVLLKDDRTWEYVQSGGATSEEPKERHAELALIRRFDYDDACRLGFKLRNKLPYEIRNIVFRFSAFIEPSVVYQDVSRSFDNIRTSKSQYKEIIFRGVSCQRIHHVKVHGADHCIMGHLTKWSEEEGECLSLVDFMPTDLISISK
jgi:hypothetical protein